MPDRYFRGVVYKLINSLLFAVMSLLIVRHLQDMPPIQFLFMRTLLGAFLCLIIANIMQLPIAIRWTRQQLKLYIWRALVNLAAMLAWVQALQYIPMSEATALAYIGPVWSLLVAQLFFAERLNWTCVCVVILNFLGVLAILQPNWQEINWLGVSIALLCTALWAWHEVICKKQSASEHYVLQALYNFTFGTLFAAPIAFAVWQPIDIESFAYIALFSTIGVANVMALFLSYVYAPLMLLAPFSYSRLLFVVILAYFFQNITPSYGCLAGAVLILMSNIYLIRNYNAK